MDLITNIELEMKEAFLTIDSSTILPQGYQYYNTVSVVNIDDECVAVERGQYPTIAIYLDPDEAILSGNQRAYMNELRFKIVCAVALDTDADIDAPRFEINQKMSEILSDIKALLFHNYNLNCSCDLVELKSSRREYSPNNDAYRVGDLILTVNVKYNQSRINPNIKCNI